MKKGVPENFAKFTGKQLCESLLFKKAAAGLRTATLKKTLAQVFPCEFREFFKYTFLREHLQTTASAKQSNIARLGVLTPSIM